MAQVVAPRETHAISPVVRALASAHGGATTLGQKGCENSIDEVAALRVAS